MTHHVLKATPDNFAAYDCGVKPWSMRNNDRDFIPGDTVRFIEWDCGATGRMTGVSKILEVWDSYGWLPAGHVMLSLGPCSDLDGGA